jgi:coenzyme F420-dependent glucose-6-phosphate dehydrogenase
VPSTRPPAQVNDHALRAGLGDAGEDDVAGSMPVGPDPERVLEAIREFERGGYTHVYLHQIGPDQEGFFRFFEREVLPKLG